MAEQPIDLNRKEVRELWDFMAKVDTTLTRVSTTLDDHDIRIVAIEKVQARQSGASSLARWVWPIVLSIGALVLSAFAFIRRAI